MAVKRWQQTLRVLGAAAVTTAVLAIGSLHAIGYREAFARVEDYVASFDKGIPGAIEPYGVNRLLKTTQVRYNDSLYQVSFSSTRASAAEVVEAYGRALAGPKLQESSPDGSVQSLYHYDGQRLTAVRAMPFGPSQAGSMVQKVHSVRPAREVPPSVGAVLGMAELSAAAHGPTDAQAPPERRLQELQRLRHALVGSLRRGLSAAAEAREGRGDRPGFDLQGVPRYPGAVRLSSIAIDDGKLQVVRYRVGADAESVAYHFVRSLPGHGWTPDPVSEAALSAGASDGAHHLVFRQGNAALDVLVTSGERSGSTSVTVMLQ
jgi:hypothetical protein